MGSRMGRVDVVMGQADDPRLPSVAEIDAVPSADGLRTLSGSTNIRRWPLTVLRGRPSGWGVGGFSASGPLTAAAHHSVARGARIVDWDQRADACRRALREIAALGVVAVHENGGPGYRRLN